MDDLLPSSPAYHDPPLHPSYGYGCRKLGVGRVWSVQAIAIGLGKAMDEILWAIDISTRKRGHGCLARTDSLARRR